MALALLAHTIAQSANGNFVTTSGIDTTGADLIVVCECATTNALADSKSNTWTGLTAKTINGVIHRIWYCDAPTVGSGHTFNTSNSSGNFPSLAVLAFSGGLTSGSFDQQNGATSASSNAMQPGSVTPGANNEVVVSMVGYANTTAVSVDSGQTISDQAQLLGGLAFALTVAYEIQTTATARNPTFSWTTGTPAGCCIASFKAAAGGATQGLSLTMTGAGA